MKWWIPVSHFLNRKRGYAAVIGSVIWLIWILWILYTPNNVDPATQIVGRDYIQFYMAGTTLRLGESAQLYDFGHQLQLEQTLGGFTSDSFVKFLYPPFMAWLFVPLSLIPYIWSLTIWSLLGLLGLWLSLRWLGFDRPKKPFVWALTWFPIFATISFGQNGLLSLTILSFTYFLWQRERTFASGLVCSLLLFKPQFALGVGLLWLLRWRHDWKALLGFILGGGMLAALSFGFLPEASRSYFSLSYNFIPSFINQESFPIWHSQTTRGFWLLLLPGKTALAEVLALLLAAGGIAALVIFRGRHRFQKPLLFSAAICTTLWITPHAMIYDWALLLIPAVLLWKSGSLNQDLLRLLIAVIWIVSLISVPLTLLQLELMSRAVQISIPVFLLVVIIAWSSLTKINPETSSIDNSVQER
jgi:hypothetical protein